MNGILRGTYKGKQYRLKVECYSKTPSIKVQLIPTDGSDRITVTQDIGQSLPRYQAYLVENILDVDSFEFMAFMEQNNLGHIADYKRYSMDTGGTRKTVALFQLPLRASQEIPCFRLCPLRKPLRQAQEDLCRAPHPPDGGLRGAAHGDPLFLPAQNCRLGRSRLPA